MGTFVMVAWFVVLVPLAGLLLGGMAYSMFARNLEMGPICALFCFLPLLLTIAWGSTRLSGFLSKNRFVKEKLSVLWADYEEKNKFPRIFY
jgi:hypothetical protein